MALVSGYVAYFSCLHNLCCHGFNSFCNEWKYRVRPVKPSCKTCEYVIDPEVNSSSYVGCQLGVYPFPILKSIDITKLSCNRYRLVGNIFRFAEDLYGI